MLRPRGRGGIQSDRGTWTINRNAASGGGLGNRKFDNVVAKDYPTRGELLTLVPAEPEVRRAG
jgi:hypothetical protein